MKMKMNKQTNLIFILYYALVATILLKRRDIVLPVQMGSRRMVKHFYVVEVEHGLFTAMHEGHNQFQKSHELSLASGSLVHLIYSMEYTKQSHISR